LTGLAEGERVRLWYSVSQRYYRDEVGQQLVLEVHEKEFDEDRVN
jgi:hypothetical protein